MLAQHSHANVTVGFTEFINFQLIFWLLSLLKLWQTLSVLLWTFTSSGSVQSMVSIARVLGRASKWLLLTLGSDLGKRIWLAYSRFSDFLIYALMTMIVKIYCTRCTSMNLWTTWGLFDPEKNNSGSLALAGIGKRSPYLTSTDVFASLRVSANSKLCMINTFLINQTLSVLLLECM